MIFNKKGFGSTKAFLFLKSSFFKRLPLLKPD